MMRPPEGFCRFIWANAARAHSQLPVRFAPTTRSQSSTGNSSTGTGLEPAPALLNSRSTRPNPSTAAAKRRSTSPGTETSATTARASPAQRPTTSSSGPGRRPHTATAQPPALNSRALAAPIPVPPPVTTATRRSATLLSPALSPARVR